MFTHGMELFWPMVWQARRNKNTILVVEDDEFLKAALVPILYSVDPQLDLRWVTSYEEALRAMDRELPDLIIADCLLGPGGTGLDLFKHCQKVGPGISFLMITGLGKEGL